MHEADCSDVGTRAVVTELVRSGAQDVGSDLPLRRLRFFTPSLCGRYLDSSEVQSEVRLDPSGQPDSTWLSLPYHRCLAAASCWHQHTVADARRPGNWHILIVGGGGGCVAQYLHSTLRSAVDVVELEPAVVELAHKFFTPSGRVPVGLNWHTEDGASFITRHAVLSMRFDTVILDVSRSYAAPQAQDKWGMAAPSPTIVAPTVLSELRKITRCVLINVLPSENGDTSCTTTDHGASGGQVAAERCVQRIARLLAATGFTVVDEIRAEAMCNRILVGRSTSKTMHALHNLTQMSSTQGLLGSLNDVEIRRLVPAEEQGWRPQVGSFDDMSISDRAAREGTAGTKRKTTSSVK